MLPAGTALAATPEPVASAASASAPAAQAPGAQAPGEPAARPQGADEPTPTPDPTPSDPTETVTPAPSTEPTAEPCAPLPLAPLGEPGDAIRQVAIESQSTACFTVTVEQAGTHRILIDGGYDTYPGLYSGEDKVTCQDWSYKDAWCDLAAGQYTLKLTNHAWETARNRVALVPLAATAQGACPAVPGTGYTTAPATGTGAGALGVVCHTFTAAPGERVTTELRRSGYGDSFAWISDATGKRLCVERNQDGSEGCVLPGGTGGYRVHAIVGDQEDGTRSPYTLKVRRLSDPEGCATVAPAVYGTAPDRSGPATGCKTFTPTASGRYDVRAVSEEGHRSNVSVYAQDGTYACRGYDAFCTLTAGTTYTVLTDDAVQVFGRGSTEGCVDGVALAAAYRGTFSAPGEVHCLNLPVPQGAHLAVLSDLGTDITVYDATGAEQCLNATNLWDATCVLGGTAPYRAVVVDEDVNEGGDGYGLVVHRTDAPAPAACRTFTAGDFSAAPARSVVRTGDGVFADCLTIPAGAHSANELFQIAKGTGGLSAEAVVVDAQGKVSCEIRNYYGTFSVCDLTPGLAHMVLVQGRDAAGETPLTRQDVTATAVGCVTTPAVAVGGPSTGGVPAAPGTFQCRRVTTSAAGDTLHLDVRDTGDAVRLMAFDAEGDVVCDYFTRGCAATGSAAYQVLLQVPAGGTSPAAYRLDAARIGTPSGPAPECAQVANVSYGFGPLTGTLSEQHSALCWAVPTASGDRFDVTLTPAGTFETMPRPRLYDRSSRVNACGGAYTSEGQVYQCSLSNAYPKTAKPTTLVIGLPEKPAQTSTPVHAQFSCDGPVCGTDERSLGTVGPATLGRGKITMTVTGSALPASAKVVLTNGSYRAESTTVSVAPDRRSMTVALDLTGAPLGSLSTSVHAFGAQYMKPSVTVVAALRNTTAPTVVGTPVIGAKVTAGNGAWSPAADSFVYQWKANGVSISGATASSYVVPSTLLGKQLSVAVGARKAGHPAVLATSAGVTVKALAPKPTRNPYITGSARVGGKVTAVVGAWSPAPTSYTYQWRVNGLAIPGATGASYVLPPAALGKKLTVTVAAHRTGHLSGAYTTAGYTVALGLAPKATTAPYVTGTVRVGRVLTLNRGAWTPAPTSYTYQWYANGRAIAGATRATHTLTAAQRGTRITVKVTAHRTGHTAGTAWTRSTAAVTG
ncbi:hypothetical protein [Streptomyces sp. CB02261]|uniref:hypothetical protein n=1 Tax=Streptomyces sp. CB02261 TaxID=1703940 RepID=UPI00093C8202|nr:hypothetical protein [Streptomyces sp. CB02261]